MGIKRASYAMLTNQVMTAQDALEYGMVNEVLPYDRVVPRAYEIADMLMQQHRTVRRLTTQVVRKPWKDALANSALDFVFATEMYANMCNHYTHDGINNESVYAGGENNGLIKNTNAEKEAEYEAIRATTERDDWLNHLCIFDD